MKEKNRMKTKSKIELNENYWDCECPENYIHSKETGNYCPKCKRYQDEQPDSREIEIKYNYDSTNDNVIKKEKTND